MKRLAAAMLLLAATVADGTAQIPRNPPNAFAESCLHDPVEHGNPFPFSTTAVESEGSDSVRLQFTLTNYCETRIRVSGLAPATAHGAYVVAGAPIEVVAISEGDVDGETAHAVAGTAMLAGFDVPALATVTQTAAVRLAAGVASDVIGGIASSYAGAGGSGRVGDKWVEGIGIRSVCVHYADRPCGAYQ